MMATDGLRCKHHCDRFGWTHGRHQVYSAHTNLHTAFSTTEVSEISRIHRKDALSTQCSHKHAYCILCNWGHVRCIHRKDALSTQCSHKPAYRILCYWGVWDKLHSQEGYPKYTVLTQTCVLSLAGAATSIIFVTTKVLSWQTYLLSKQLFVMTNMCLLWQNTSFVLTKMCCHDKTFVATNVFLWRQT